jgi:uncharacterized protein (DUF1800 family)
VTRGRGENGPPPAELTPEELLLPFRAGLDGPWDRAAAAHLVRRAAFGMPERLVESCLSRGPRGAVEDLLTGRPDLPDERFTSEAALQVGSLEAAQGAWVYRMLRGGSPAREKLALFWHGHFATSNRKVENPRLMMRQVELFRSKGEGPFEELLLAVARDPAMLLWLDGNSNRRGQPNENFARELMELFSLGIGHYTESDIKEAARAFTGFHVKDDEFWFNARAHDDGPKQVLGRSGPLRGEEVVRLCAEREGSAEFVAGKLFEFYVHSAPSPDLKRELGKLLRSSGNRTGEFLSRLLSSRVFHSRWARRALVSTPADFAVGSLLTLGGAASAKAVARAMAAMGMELFVPPSVKGWEMGPAWLSSTTLLARYRFAQALSSGGAGADPELNAQIPWDRLGGDSRRFLERLIPEGLPAPLAADLLSAGRSDPRSLVTGCLELPEYQFV